jgi:hypothetical protein
MKNLIYICLLLLAGNAFAQDKPKEVKEEVEVRTLKSKDEDKTVEKKLKVVTRETASVELDKKDKNKTNQDRVKSQKTVEKTVMIDNDDDNAYDVLTQETYYVAGDEQYMFTPNKRGFDIAFDKNKENDHYVKVGKAWTTSTHGYYILNGNMHSGIGYFDADGNFNIEYYNKDTDQVEVKTYKKH